MTVVVDGARLFGITKTSGEADGGTVFRLQTDGSGFRTLHSFDGSKPKGNTGYGPNSLTLDGSTLYGTTLYGGPALGLNQGGTIFKVNTDGSGFRMLHAFTTSSEGGYCPGPGLVVIGDFLYGMTSVGGAMFRINKDGSALGIVHSFSRADVHGRLSGTPVFDSPTFFAMSAPEAWTGKGAVFRVSKDGTGFEVLHSFAGNCRSNAWWYPGALVLAGSTIYGATSWGGSTGQGTLFRVNTDGTGFKVLHPFDGGLGNMDRPTRSLTFDGSILYGTTGDGGTLGYGTIFSVNTDGSGFKVVYSFGGYPDAKVPLGLTLAGSTLYGTTEMSGIGTAGTVFSFPTRRTGRDK